MNKEETMELYAQGREAWNAWAKYMLAQRSTVIKTGKWIDIKGEEREKTRDWLNAARADFSNHVFEDKVNFAHFFFPGDTRFNRVTFNNAIFDEAEFNGNVWFEEATFTSADFRRTAFKGDVRFHRTAFEGVALFEAAIFMGKAWFGQATIAVGIFNYSSFHDDAWFGNTAFTHPASFGNTEFKKAVNFYASVFNRDVVFWGAKFGGSASFFKARFNDVAKFTNVTFLCYVRCSEAIFNEEANFSGVTFTDNVEFNRTSFSGRTQFDETTFCGNVDFSQAVFGYTSFSGALFKADSNFVAMQGQSSFTLKDATFFVVPDFGQAHFSEAPRLDNLRFQTTSVESRRPWMSPPTIKPDISARWRALKRIAVQAHDHERELDFLAEEIKSLRGEQDWLLPNPLSFRRGEPICWPGGGRYWAGLFYQWFSDFGRSTLRPFLCWTALTIAFAAYYFSLHSDTFDQSTNFGLTSIIAINCDPFMAALYLSIHNGLVISGLGRAEKLTQSYACLYGSSGKDQLVPLMPDAVVFIGIAQTILSAVLIFLFLLALRNYFRIR